MQGEKGNTTVNQERGITLLLVVVILSAILSIGIGIFNVILGQILLTGEVGDSFRALYASDQGIERTLYRDRSSGSPLADGSSENSTTAGLSGGALSLNSCYFMTVSKSGGITTIRANGEYPCGGTGSRFLKRGFEVTY